MGNNDRERWINEGRERGATHLISVCDVFEYTDYPVYVMPGDDVQKIRREYEDRNMQHVNEVIDLQPDDAKRKYSLQRMTGKRAKEILADLLAELSNIDAAQLTTFELSLLRRCADNPPKQCRGVEEKLADN